MKICSPIMQRVNQSGIVYNLTTLKKLGNIYKLSTLKLPTKVAGYEDSNTSYSEKNSINDEKLRNNLTRAKTTIKELVLCNDFKYFVTLTLDKEKYDRYDLKKYIKDLGQFIRDYRKKYNSDIQYILIPEPHKDGAWHMHGVIFGINEEHLKSFDLIPAAPEKLKGKGYYNFELYEKKFGFCSFGKIKSKEKVSNYITKYIQKDLGKNIAMSSKSYYTTRGLEKPITIKKGTLQSAHLIEYDFENEYVQIKQLTKIDNIDII